MGASTESAGITLDTVGTGPLIDFFRSFEKISEEPILSSGA
jgi:hypothetical protein